MVNYSFHGIPVVVGTAAYFALGALWYGAFATPWMKAVGVTKEEVKAEGGPPWIYGVQFLSTLAMCALATWILADALKVNDLIDGICGGVAIGVIAALASSGDFLYEQRRRNIALWAINSGYRLVGMTLLGVIVAVS